MTKRDKASRKLKNPELNAYISWLKVREEETKRLTEEAKERAIKQYKTHLLKVWLIAFYILMI